MQHRCFSGDRCAVPFTVVWLGRGTGTQSGGAIVRDVTHTPRSDAARELVEKIIVAIMFAIPISLIALA